MLAVVEGDKDGLVPQGVQQRIERGAVRLLTQLQPANERRRDLVGVADRCEFDKPDSLPGPVKQLCSCLEGEAGLPRPSRAREGDEPRVQDEGPDFGELSATPDEGAEGGRQVVGELGIFEGAKRWELRLEPSATS